MAPAKETVAFVGIGTMGHAMATNAVRAGFTTTTWNRTRGATEDLAALGAEVADTPADAVGQATIVVTMLSDADVVLAIAREHGMLAAMADGAIWVQMSTIGVEGIEAISALVASQRPDVTLVDAPVSGSKVPAQRGELTIFASGPERVRARLGPLFDALGQRTVWVGPLGAGSRLKLAANAWLALAAEAVTTSLALAHQLGIETDTVIGALHDSPLVSPWQAAKLQRISQGDYSAQFALSPALKDVRLAIEAGDDGRFVALEGLAKEWQRVLDQGFGDQDVTVVAHALARPRRVDLDRSS